MALDFSVKPEKQQNLNLVTFLDYYSRLRLLATTLFEWSGLPESINVRYLEQCLYERGRVILFYDPELGHLALPGGQDGSLNVYGDPIDVRVTGANGYNKQLSKGDYVMIRNNFDCQPTDSTIRLFAQRLANAERTIDTNINAQRTPLLITGDKKEMTSLKTLYRQYEGNEPVIYAALGLNPDFIKVMQTPSPYVADKLMIYKKNLWNECMSFLGINNANTDKRERLVVPEVEANDSLVSMSAEVMLTTRKMAAAEIKNLFGLAVQVKPRNEQIQAEKAEQEDDQDE